MRKIILKLCIIGVVSAGLLYAQGKNGVTETAQPSADTTTVPVVTTAATVSVDTKESKTIKTEIQSPGVVTEYKEDGIKVVTINLSEVDENKLPEKYEAKVILEAPIMMATEELDTKTGEIYFSYQGKKISRIINGEFSYIEKPITESGVFLDVPEGSPNNNFDIKISENGDIYISDLINSRIQKFDNNGKHLKNIPLKNVYKSNTEGSGDRPNIIKMKDEIALSKGKVYIRDTAKNIIEKIDETGKVLETIDVSEKNDGKSSRKMKMWVNEERVGVNGLDDDIDIIRFDLLNNNNVRSVGDKEKVVKLNEIVKLKMLSNNTIKSISQKGRDDQKNVFLSVGVSKDVGTFKISQNGEVLAKIEDWKCWFLKEWLDGCDIPMGGISGVVKGGILSNTFVDAEGNIYLSQLVCCKTKDCLGQIRIIKITAEENK